MKEIRKLLDYVDKHTLYPDIKVISGPSLPEVTIDGREITAFCSNNYLGLAYSKPLIEAAVKAAEEYGTGSSGSRLLSGNLKIFADLEKEIAAFKKSEDAITFIAGYMANVGTISAVSNVMKVNPFDFFRRRTVILSDELNHASIIDGCKLSEQKVVVYRHCDMDDLRNKLRKFNRRRKLIVTDSVFSMDGDIAPLPEIVRLARDYNAMVMVDDAHATGVLGKNGSGSAEHFNLDKEIDIKMGTLSKAVGSSGGYVAGSEELIRYLRIGARAYMFATAMSPISAGASLAAIREIQQNHQLRQRLWENATHLREGFKKIGFDTLTSETPIIPILIGDEEKAIKFAQTLFERGFLAPCVRWPAVEKGKARIRCTVMSPHTPKQIDAFLNQCQKIGRELGVI